MSRFKKSAEAQWAEIRARLETLDRKDLLRLFADLFRMGDANRAYLSSVRPAQELLPARSSKTPAEGELLNPNDLQSMPQLAREYAYASDHLRRMAALGKIKGWYLGGSWLTTRRHLEEYLADESRLGRPKKGKPRRVPASTE
ncbi:MAG TPA: hypothetical protein VGP72_05455 [Planctomycetota bacterium]